MDLLGNKFETLFLNCCLIASDVRNEESALLCVLCWVSRPCWSLLLFCLSYFGTLPSPSFAIVKVISSLFVFSCTASWEHTELKLWTLGDGRRCCTVYLKSMKFIVLMLLTSEHRFITFGKCLFQNSFNGPCVHSVVSRSLFSTSAAVRSEHTSPGASPSRSIQSLLSCSSQIWMLKSRWIYVALAFQQSYTFVWGLFSFLLFFPILATAILCLTLDL